MNIKQLYSIISGDECVGGKNPGLAGAVIESVFDHSSSPLRAYISMAKERMGSPNVYR